MTLSIIIRDKEERIITREGLIDSGTRTTIILRI